MKKIKIKFIQIDLIYRVLLKLIFMIYINIYSKLGNTYFY